MGKASADKTPSKRSSEGHHAEGRGLLFLGSALLVLLSLLSFEVGREAHNWLGMMGWIVGLMFTWMFGIASYLIVPFLGWLGWQMLLGRTTSSKTSKLVSFSVFLLSSGLLLNLCAERGVPLAEWCAKRIYAETSYFDFPYPHHTTRFNLGGVPLYYLYKDLPTVNLQRMLSDVGIGLTFSITALVSFLLFTEIRLLPTLQSLRERFSRAKEALSERLKRAAAPEPIQPSAQSMEEIERTLTRRAGPQPIYASRPKAASQGDEGLKIRTMHDKVASEPHVEKEEPPAPTAKRQASTSKNSLKNALKAEGGDFTAYQLPSPTLLNNPKKIDHPSLKKELKRQAEILEETLLSFGIEAKVGEINCGPTITSFEVHPAIGVKVQKIKTLENDIALNLQAKSIRIIAPIPGKAAVGVEVPSLYPQEVSFKELLLDYQQNPRKMMIPLLLGKGVSGDNVISDLSKMPHCLIAGATGSGKSVCINTVIMSILMNARPDEIKLLMVDPKKVELTSYTALPHMIAPVITEAHGAYAALQWLVKEMQVRYEILKQLGMRNITAFNNRAINTELESSLSIPIPRKMHGIVAIIDEFADLMMSSSSDLETPIARIAQMARAVGIHLILATQRPSREVITGLIKANFPTRIAFKVASRVNSQIILDDIGAESLLGNGDMLFLPPGTSSLMRAQGAYVSDEEINRVVSFICTQASPNYLIESFDRMRLEESAPSDSSDDGSRDTLYDQALITVLETKTASTTFLQRKLKIGYARAASLMDELEANGVISAQEGAKPRRIILTDNQRGSAYESQQDYLE